MQAELRRLTGQRVDAVALADAAGPRGCALCPMTRDKVARGLTTEEEIKRVLF